MYILYIYRYIYRYIYIYIYLYIYCSIFDCFLASGSEAKREDPKENGKRNYRGKTKVILLPFKIIFFEHLAHLLGQLLILSITERSH